jgi:hypothetical protein
VAFRDVSGQVVAALPVSMPCPLATLVPKCLTRQHLRVMVGDHNHLFLIGQIDANCQRRVKTEL